MDLRLQDVLRGREDNYLLPFLWMHTGKRDKLPGLVEAIYASGARAFCVESRPHEHFCEHEWWGDMDILLAEAEKRAMKVWILDDKHFPTGYANGLLMAKYPERRKWHLVEEHVDVIGPQAECGLIVKPRLDKESAGMMDRRLDSTAEDELVGVFAYKRLPGGEQPTGTPIDSPDGEQLAGPPVDLTANVKGNFLIWDVPEGVYRVFFLYKSRHGASGRSAESIDMLSSESVNVLIEAVYEPHYQHYARYFGNTLAGFFSDEPSFGNELVNWRGPRGTMYDNLVGTRGLALPWSDELLQRMNAELGYDALPYLGGLWYKLDDGRPELRIAYMNAATSLWRENFSYQLGDWCRAHGVEYIGHIIEDMNAHAHLSCSGGHFFRSLDGQDMSGIDIVLHQFMPGFAKYPHAASCAGGVMDTEFFHYVLGKLAASHARLQPRMQGRAMCEVFGAYGWAEGADLMKAMMDHLLIRGVNHFVPHAFSPDFPDPDCPPHFSAEDQNPQFGGFSSLMHYTNKVSHLLTGARHIANAAILYHAEAEWSGKQFMLTQKPARVLYDSQIDYDIVPLDYIIDNATVRAGKLMLENGEQRDCLVIPGAEYLPQSLIARLSDMAAEGLPIWFVEQRPENCTVGEIVRLYELANRFIDQGFTDVRLSKACPLLRVFHVERDGAHIFMLSNESVQESAEVEARLPVTGDYTRLDLQLDVVSADHTKDGTVSLKLAPYQSVILEFDTEPSTSAQPVHERARQALELEYEVSVAASEKLDEFKPLGKCRQLVNMTGFDGPCGPEFSGKFRYKATFTAPAGVAMLSLGAAGQCSQVELNGIPLAWRMCPPHLFDVRGAIREGENTIVITTANTLANRIQDPFSHYVQLPPAGLLGPVELIIE